MVLHRSHFHSLLRRRALHCTGHRTRLRLCSTGHGRCGVDIVQPREPRHAAARDAYRPASPRRQRISNYRGRAARDEFSAPAGGLSGWRHARGPICLAWEHLACALDALVDQRSIVRLTLHVPRLDHGATTRCARHVPPHPSTLSGTQDRLRAVAA